jgi:transcription initiation factor TFIIIB Brf1 subunit/transcription initiation factor TFIIB
MSDQTISKILHSRQIENEFDIKLISDLRLFSHSKGIMTENKTETTSTTDDVHYNIYCDSKQCIGLKHELVLSDDNGFVCDFCGTCYGSDLDSSAEWRFYGSNDNCSQDPSRTDFSYNKCMPHMCLYNTFSGYLNKNSLLYKAQLWLNNDHREKAIKQKFDEIQHKCSGHLPQTIIEQSKMRFFELSNERSHYGKTIIRKDNLIATMASAVYFVCKKHNRTIRYKELAEWFEISEYTIQSVVKNFLKNDTEHTDTVETDSTNWQQLLERYCVLCGFNQLYSETKQLIEECDKLSLNNDKTPQTICAGAIYIISVIKYGANINKKYITSKCMISNVTIGRCINSYKKHLSDLLFLDPKKK